MRALVRKKDKHGYVFDTLKASSPMLGIVECSSGITFFNPKQ